MKLGNLKSLKRTTDRLVVLMRGFQNILVHVGCITNTTCGFTGRRMILSVKLSKYLSIIISGGSCRQANILFYRCLCMEFEIEPVYQPCETSLEWLSSGNISDQYSVLFVNSISQGKAPSGGRITSIMLLSMSYLAGFA